MIMRLRPLLLLCTYMCILSFHLHGDATEQNSLEDNACEIMTDEFDDIFFDEEDSFEFMNEYLDTTATDRVVNSIDPKVIMTILNFIDAPAILELPFYLHTNII